MSAKVIERSCKCEERADVPGVGRAVDQRESEFIYKFRMLTPEQQKKVICLVDCLPDRE